MFFHIHSINKNSSKYSQYYNILICVFKRYERKTIINSLDCTSYCISNDMGFITSKTA